MLAGDGALTSPGSAWSGRIASFLRSDEPAAVGEPDLASVAVILVPTGGTEVLLIERAVREDDPWSGQVAFPGGRTRSDDGTLRGTAARETQEEVGFNPDGTSRFLGYMNVFNPRNRNIRVVPSVFLSEGRPRLSPNIEVASYQWVPLRAFKEEKTRTKYLVARNGGSVAFPAFRVGPYLVWGLTERIISRLVELG